MKYVSTRGNFKSVSGPEAITLGMVPRGGLFVPESIPQVEIRELSRLNYRELSAEILKLFLSNASNEFSEKEIKEYTEAAYQNAKFDAEEITPLRKLDSTTAVLELWHGPTAAFKDLALQIMPYFLSGSVKKLGRNRETVILVATSGDTGKAALEGFKNVPGIRIIVFYPKGGVSHIQELQMETTNGNNTTTVAVEGNFDDCQNMVKSLFSDTTFNNELVKKGFELSSANSINWGRLVPQIIYYFWAYFSMIKNKMIQMGDNAVAVVPTGNFGNILAGHYAKEMGLPLSRLVCASNKNNVLSDFINTGAYNRKRKFYKTSSPSMDILISSNLERYLFEISNHNAVKINRWYDELSAKGEFKVDDTTRQRLKNGLYGNFADEEETLNEIKKISEHYGYITDPHTAVGFNVLEKYRAESNDNTPAFICSTASPYKFNQSVYQALTGDTTLTDEIEIALKLEKMTGLKIHRAVKDIEKLTVKKSRVIRTSDVMTTVRSILGLVQK